MRWVVRMRRCRQATDESTSESVVAGAGHPDLDEAGKATVQAEIERLLRAHARQIYQVLPGETDRRLKELLTVTAHEHG